MDSNERIPGKTESGPPTAPETRKPEFKFSFYFTPHAFEKDAENLKEIFREADAYAPEYPGWTLNTAQFYNDVAQGRLNVRDDPELVRKLMRDNPFLLGEFDILYGSGKPIIFLDISGEFHSKLNKERVEFEDKVLKAKGLFWAGRFEEALLLSREAAKGLAEVKKTRENGIRKIMLEALPRMIHLHPYLGDKIKSGKPLKVLLSLGALHTPLYQKLQEEGVDVQRKLSHSPLIFPPWYQVERSYSFGKEPSDEVVARGLLGVMLSRYIEELSKSSKESETAFRKLVSRLSLADIKKLSTQVGVAGKGFVDALAGFGVKLPRSREEFEKLLS